MLNERLVSLLVEVQCVSHALFLRVQIALIVFVGGNLNRHVLDNLKSVSFKTNTLYGIVGEEANLADANLAQDLSSHAVVAQVGVEAQMDIGIYRI